MYRLIGVILVLLVAVGCAFIGYGLLTIDAPPSPPAQPVQAAPASSSSMQSSQSVEESASAPVTEQEISQASEVPPQSQLDQPQPVATPHMPAEESSRYWLGKLSGAQRTAYQRMVEAVENCQNFLELSDLQITRKQFAQVLEFCVFDHPEYFWLSKSYQYRYEKSKPDIVQQIVLLYTDGKYVDQPGEGQEMVSQVSRKAILERRAAFNRQAENFLRSVPVHWNDLQKQQAAYDYVIATTRYDNAAVDSFTTGQEDSYTAYGALISGLAVCEGYSELFQYLCNQLGLRCIVVVGESQGISHQWNIVWLDGAPAYADPTWDDNDALEELGEKSYFYLNLTDDMLKSSHTIGTGASISRSEYLAMLPRCGTPSLYYYARNALQLDFNLGLPANSDSVLQGTLRRGGKYVLVFFPKSLTTYQQENWLQDMAFSTDGSLYRALDRACVTTDIYRDFTGSYFTLAERSVAAIAIS